MIQPLPNPRIARIVADVVGRAIRVLDARRVWLFGSQASGSPSRASDVDLAFELSPAAAARWAAFVTEAQDEVPALVDLDLVDLAACHPRLAHEILTTGRIVYQAP